MAYLTLSPEPASRARKSIDDYEFLAGEGPKGFSTELGKGAYGSVRRVRDKQTGEICAMKIMSKKSIMQFATKENLKREISIQRSIFHPNIIKLFHHFEDDENVYLVLEYAANGSLFHHLRKTRKFTEEQAFIFFLQTCLGIDYLHKRKILHRDLKPENLLLDKDYNIKLCDFGWSAENQSKRVTFCGTVDYMAPEMLKSKPYDHKLDIWCLGILLYELLHGVAPFKGKSDREKVDNIVKNQTINFGPDISPEAVDLVKRILRPVPTERLSMDEILRHPWMKKYERVYGTNIQGLQRQQDDLIREYQMSLGRQETGDYIGAAIYDNIYLLNYDENADYKQQFASGGDYQHLANKIPMYNSQTGGNYGMNYNSQPYGLSDNYSGLGGQNQYAGGYKSYDPLSPTDKYNQSPYQTNAYKYNEYGGKSFEYGSLHTSEKEKKSGNLSANQGRRRSPSEEYEEARNYGIRKSQMGRRRKSAEQPGLWTRILMGLGCIEREKEGGKTH